jgi:hypothetical protein
MNLPQALPWWNMMELGPCRVLYTAASAAVTWSSCWSSHCQSSRPSRWNPFVTRLSLDPSKYVLVLIMMNWWYQCLCSWTNIRHLHCCAHVLCQVSKKYFCKYIFLLTSIKNSYNQGFDIYLYDDYDYIYVRGTGTDVILCKHKVVQRFRVDNSAI